MKTYIIAIAIGISAGMLNAQTTSTQPATTQTPSTQATPHKQDPQRQTERIAKQLALSEDQKSKILVVNTDEAQKMEGLAGKARKEYAEGRKGIEQDRENRFREILTAEQFQKFMQHKEERKQQRKDQRQKSNEVH